MGKEKENYINDNFVNIKANLNNLWLYQVRVNLVNSFKEHLHNFHGEVLDLGCGIMPYKDIILSNSNVTKYVGMDLEQPTYYGLEKPDLTWDGKIIPFEDASVDCVIATEVLEHCFEPELLLKEVYRVLKTGGTFFCTVPFVWHLHESPYDYYRYTPFSLEKKISDSGFNSIEIKALGGWDSALSQLLGLWITFRPLKRLHKTILLRLVFFIVKRLKKTDKKPTSFNNRENSMISGLTAICYK